MRVSIEDKEALAALSIESLRAYLDRDDRWTYAEDIPGKAAVYQHKDKTGRLREVIVPLRRDFADYAARMGDAVATLGRVEDRSELDIYADLRAPNVAHEVHERIRRWLAEEHWAVRDVATADFPFSIIVTLEGGQVIDVFQHRNYVDRITLAQHWNFDEEFRETFSKLPDDVQRGVIYDIYRDVLTSGLDLARLGVPLREMRYGAFIYYDGLTKDVLVQKLLLIARMHHLTMRTFGRAHAEAGRPSEVASNLLHLVPAASGPLTAAS
jgi:hypothetical protein